MKALTGVEHLPLTNGHTVADFWSWAYSDILSNRNRAIFAEFIVSAALGCIDRPRREWDAVDVRYQEKKIEVKTSAYLQNWQQKRPSSISFDISPKQGWDAETNSYALARKRNADCYVFCLFHALEKETADVVDLSQWHYYVLRTDEINRRFPGQKTLSLKRLQSLCKPVCYPQLKEVIDGALREDSTTDLSESAAI